MAEILINTLKKTRSDLSKGRGHIDALCGCHNRTLYHNFGAECEIEEDLLTLSMLPLIVKRNCCVPAIMVFIDFCKAFDSICH